MEEIRNVKLQVTIGKQTLYLVKTIAPNGESFFDIFDNGSLNTLHTMVETHACEVFGSMLGTLAYEYMQSAPSEPYEHYQAPDDTNTISTEIFDEAKEYVRRNIEDFDTRISFAKDRALREYDGRAPLYVTDPDLYTLIERTIEDFISDYCTENDIEEGPFEERLSDELHFGIEEMFF